MKTYPKYKDSGVEWIGEIPTNWVIKKTTFVTNDIGSGTTPKSGEDRYYENGDIPWLITGDLNDGLLFDTSKKITQLAIKDYPTLKLYPEDSVSIAMYGATIGKLGYLKLSSSVNQANCVFVFNRGNCSKFWFYLFLGGRPHIISLSYGGGQPNISQDLLKSLRFPTPPLHEQKQISDYLDRKTQQIDDLVEKTERKIELLKEQRSSLINQCVTKGLDPNVETKDSGVEWIGEIPRGWKLQKITRVCTKIRNGYVGPTRDIMKDQGVKYIQGIHIKSGEIKYTPNGPYYVSPEWSEEHKETLLEEGDVLVVQTGTIGQVGFVTKEFENSNCHALIIVRINKNIGHGRFLLYSFVGGYIQKYLQSIKTGEILYHINTKKLRFLNVLIPPLSEQKQISDHLNRKTSKIDQMVNIETKRIELLEEYRQSLISNVVTGKIDVRHENVQ